MGLSKQTQSKYQFIQLLLKAFKKIHSDDFSHRRNRFFRF